MTRQIEVQVILGAITTNIENPRGCQVGLLRLEMEVEMR
jgi:hypothetical protein